MLCKGFNIYKVESYYLVINKQFMSVSKLSQRQRQKYQTKLAPKLHKTANLQQKTHEFIPFVHQRDHLGRLITKTHQMTTGKVYNKKEFQYQMMSTQTNFNRTVDSKTLNRVQANFSQIFLQRSRSDFEIRNKNKISIRKLSMNNSLIKNIKAAYKINNDKTQFKLRQKMPSKQQWPLFCPTNPGQYARQPKLIMISSIKNSINNTPLSNADKSQKVIKMAKTQARRDSLHQRVQQKVTQLKIIPPQQYIKDGLEGRQIIELNQYKTSKKLTMKISSDLEASHSNFMNKMKEAKILAHRILKDLDNIQ